MTHPAADEAGPWDRSGVYALSWKELGEALKLLSSAIAESGFIPDVVVPIAMGGLIPGTYLHHVFPDADVCPVRVRRTTSHDIYSDKQDPETCLWISDMGERIAGKDVLVVDDVAGTGTTLGTVRADLQAAGVARVVDVVVALNRRSIITPTFRAFEVTDWIVFPWESHSDLAQHGQRRLPTSETVR